MNRIDGILDKYEEYLRKAEAGVCTKVAQRVHFRDILRQMYREEYEALLEEVKKKLSDRNHVASVEEKTSKENHYVFELGIIPRHLLRCPVDRYYPSHLLSTISFIANERTLTVDIESVINPGIGNEEGKVIEKIAIDEFTQNLFMQKVAEFIEKVFEETIILDYRE
jgi:hypothetical protein